MEVTTDVLRRYDDLRRAQPRLHTEAQSFLSRKQIFEGAKELGVTDGHRLVLRSEHEMAVLMDHCLYDLRRSGCSAIDRYLRQARFPAGSPEADLAAVMPDARYSVYVVDGIRSGSWLDFVDLLRQEPVRLLDRRMSETASIDMVFATRILRFPDFAMTTGAALPFDGRMARELLHRAQPWLRREKGLDVSRLTPRQQSRFATHAIRAALDLGASEYVDSA